MLEYALLGPLEVWRDGEPVVLPGARQRALLALLLLDANRVLSAERIVERLWGETPPRTAPTSLQNAVSQLRKLLGPDSVETRSGGYRVAVHPEQVDLLRCESLLARARGEDGEQRIATLAEALALWRGEPLAELLTFPFAPEEARRLEELRIGALEEQVDASLAQAPAPPAALVAELTRLAAAHPFRERLHGQLMLALYRTGRQAEALETYHRTRRTLVDELGVEPGPALQALFGQILRQDVTDRPPAALPDGEDDQAEAIARALVAGRVVTVLGRTAGDEVATTLAKTFGAGPDAHDLSAVAQFVAVTRGVGPLYDELHRAFSAARPPAALHRFLASLPPLLRNRGSPQQLIVSSSWDDCIEQAFVDAGEPLDVVSYLATGPDRGRFAHRTAAGETRVIELPNAYVDLPVDERTVLLRIHGGYDAGPAREWESFVVSEDDHIAYLAERGFEGALPIALTARLRRSHVMFVDYGVIDWTLRVFLHRLWPDRQIPYRSWAIEAPPATLARDFWRAHGVEPIVADVESYTARLTSIVQAIGDAS